MTAFSKWLARESESDRVKAASILREMMLDNPMNDVVWDALRATGDETYNYDSFLKAADILLHLKEMICAATDQS